MNRDDPVDTRRDPGNTPSALSTIRGIRVYLRTFGCTYNVGDSWKIAEILEAQSCTLVNNPALADAIVINTCTVVGKTERNVLKELHRHANRPLYVTGCMPLVQEGVIGTVCSPVIIHPREIHDAYAKVGTVPHRSVGVVQACRGCLGSCTYCITRLARGPLESRSLREVTEETARLIDAGAVEVRLTGQDLGAWGRDTGQSLADLLRSLDALNGRFMIRPGMMNPATLYPVVNTVAEAFTLSKMFASLHLPVQSGSEEILEKMRRGYTPGEVVSIVERFEHTVPGFSLTTDVICGFPGETDEDFSKTLALLQVIQPDRVNVTRYSAPGGTPASRWKDMPDSVKKERSRRLRLLAEEIAREKNAQWKGRVVPVMITESIRAGSSMGRTREYRGVVLKGDLCPGTVLPIRLMEDRTYYFTGEPV